MRIRVSVNGSTPILINDVETTGQAREKVKAGSEMICQINGETTDDNLQLKEGDLVAFLENVKGGSLI
jgi:molybdopterin converting factor small subunit